MFASRPKCVLTFLAVTVTACGDSTAPVKPASVSASSTATVSGTVGVALATAPTFVVRDASGNALGGVAVSVAVTGGGGTLTGAPTKSSGGPTSVGTWTLGNTAGTNTITVTVNGLSPLLITATGTPDVPTQITVSQGGSQSAAAAAALPAPVVFKVADKFNNGVPGQVVTFSVVNGGGALATAASVTTDISGLATAPAWTLGKSTNAQQLRATSGNLTGTASATVASNFSLDVRYFGPAVDPSITAAFTAAAQRIQGLITGDLPDVNLTNFSVSGCGVTGVNPLTEMVDDVIVYANVAPNDGPGGILGSAGPCFVRTTGGLTLIGVMNFDVADLQLLQSTNRLGDVILHEMMHVLGFGTLWLSKGQVSGAQTLATAFIGPQAALGCQAHGGSAANCVPIPLEACGGAGTRDVHWREPITCSIGESASGFGFRTELMTGFVSAAGVANPMSQMSIGSMADIGYVVNMLPFDPYTVPSSILASLNLIRESQGMGPMALNEVVRGAIAAVDRNGRVFPIGGSPR